MGSDGTNIDHPPLEIEVIDVEEWNGMNESAFSEINMIEPKVYKGPAANMIEPSPNFTTTLPSVLWPLPLWLVVAPAGLPKDYVSVCPV